MAYISYDQTMSSDMSQNLVAPTADDLLKAEYSLYVVKYKKNYKTMSEFNKRMKYYETNKHIVHKSNKENKHFKLKLNAFADLSPEE